MPKVRLSYDVLTELAAHISKAEPGSDSHDIETALYEQFGVDIEQFKNIIEALLPLVHVGRSPLSGVMCRGFADGNSWILQTRA